MCLPREAMLAFKGSASLSNILHSTINLKQGYQYHFLNFITYTQSRLLNAVFA